MAEARIARDADASCAGREARPGSPGEPLPPPPPAATLTACALLLDLDGTLVEFAARPEEVALDPHLLELLRALRTATGGALALVSGRTIATLDRLTAPERFAAAGLHGFELRSAAGRRRSHAPPNGEALAEARACLSRRVAAHPQLLLEDKGHALALHYRRAPQLQPLALAAIANVIGRSSGLRMQRGSMVAEVMPAGISKATGVAELMGERPFLGRLPVYVGDDLTDESAFHWVNGAGGLSVHVGMPRPSAALTRLASVPAARAWLSGFAPPWGPAT